MLFAALIAIILPLTLVVGFRLPARIGMTISAIAVGLVGFLVWQMDINVIAASGGQAVHRALTIAFILFGAITLLKTLQSTGAMERIRAGFYAISPDMRIQAVLVAFALVSLLEGVSGFGTPAIIVTPLLVVLGFRPITAVSLALLGDTMACTFGAVATPLLVGLENVPQYSNALVWLVGQAVTVVDLVIGVILPLGLVGLCLWQDGRQTWRRKLHLIWQIAPWAMTVGLIYSGSAFVVSRTAGPEFSAIISGAVALIFGIISTHRRWLVPLETLHHAEKTHTEKSSMPLWLAWMPYGVVILLLLLTRTITPVKEFLINSINLDWVNIFGIEGVSSTWPIFYSPGMILLIAALSASLIGKKSSKDFAKSITPSLKVVATALSALVPTLVMVQIFSNSGLSGGDFASMPVVIGQAIGDWLGGAWVAIAPILGATGAFIAGSATVSTLTMGPIQASIAEVVNAPLISMLALHMVGAAAGNIIAIHNVVAASSAVGLAHKEGLIIRKLIVPTVIYITIGILVGFALNVLGWNKI